MNTPRHHFPDEVLLEYVAGNCGEAVSLVVACHASLCAACRRQLRWLEGLAGSMVEAATPAALRDDALERVLAQLSAVECPEPPRHRPTPPRGLEFTPSPLWPYLNTDPRTGAPAFTYIVDGIGSIDLSIAPRGGTARLVELDPSITVPLHDHGGPEYGLLFSGGLEEEDGRQFHRGDVFYRVPGERHVQAVLPGEPCVALVVNEGSLIPLTAAGDVLKLFSA